MNETWERVRAEVRRVVVGQDETVDLLLVAAAVGGHVLLEGVPGVAKTLTVNALARTLGLSFRRIQFTPDMLPSDVTGTMTLRGGELAFRPGPVFASVLLADEINRTPPKTQAALLEAMQEQQVTVDGVSHPLPEPFLVAATQNPIEYEGTYPLPEAQQDRFLFKVVLDYPTAEEEVELLRRWDYGIELRDPVQAGVTASLSGAALAEVRAEVIRVTFSDELKRYVVDLAVATRNAPELTLGASTRGEVLLLLAAKAAAAFEGRDFATPDDVKGVLRATFRHRLLLRPEAEVAGHTSDSVLESVLAQVTPPR